MLEGGCLLLCLFVASFTKPEGTNSAEVFCESFSTAPARDKEKECVREGERIWQPKHRASPSQHVSKRVCPQYLSKNDNAEMCKSVRVRL